MENENQQPKRKIDLSSYGIVIGFLCFEVLAFVSFYLGHSFILYGVLSLVLSLLLLLVTFRQIKKDGITTFAFFLFPLFVYGLLTALSSFNYGSIGAIGVAESVFVPIALSLFALSGFLSGYISKFKIRTALFVIYAALALFVFINLLITMIYYVPFYTLKYSNSYIVYNGKPSELPIGSMAYMLFGFQVKEVTLEYWTLFPSLLFTAVIPLLFVKYKENKREFACYLAFVVLAFLSLLFTISKKTMLSDIVLVLGIAVIVIPAKIIKSRKIIDTMFIALGVLFILFMIVMFLNAQANWGFVSGLRNAIAGNSLLNRLFNRAKITAVFQDLFTSFKLFGVPVGGYAFQYDNGVAQEVTNIWLLDNLLSSGLFGSLFFIGALVVGIRRLFKYIKNSDESDFNKFTIAGYVLGFLVISLFLLDYRPLVNSDRLFPLYTSAPLLIVLFLLGYVFNKSLEGQVEVVKEEKGAPTFEENREENDNETIAL